MARRTSRSPAGDGGSRRARLYLVAAAALLAMAVVTHLRTRALHCHEPLLPRQLLAEGEGATLPSTTDTPPAAAATESQGEGAERAPVSVQAGGQAEGAGRAGQHGMHHRGSAAAHPLPKPGPEPRGAPSDLPALRAWLAASRSPHVCWSREEMHAYMPPSHSARPSRAFARRLRVYEAMHRRCAARLSFRHGLPPADSFRSVLQGNGSEGHAPCQYLFYQDSIAGVGNRILAVVSAFTLALLTSRTLLLSSDSLPATAFCQPFNASSWSLPAAHFEAIVRDVAADAKPNEFPPSNRSLHLDFPSGFWWNMVCDEGQRRLARTPFVLFTSYFYTLPALYFRPAFQATLDRWFPDRLPFTRVARWLLHPANFLWVAVSQAFTAYLAPHRTRIALQIRPVEQTEEDILPRILTCAQTIAHLLPPVGLDDYEGDAMVG
ncbi:hypothetical protein CLOP_g17284 [Closterium sp. NIES-67]|nr:hypothetical protein CLOP_g17284 [Closterium sp. NIES-67]